MQFYQVLSVILALIFPSLLLSQVQENQPNIVWIVTEDNSKHYLKLYQENGASMPAIERLAERGIVFENAFSNAPVCSVARSTIISGCYAPRVGAQYHRRSTLAPMPKGLEMFPYYLRQAGYYTSNNSKEDYNFVKSAQVWDESSNRASYQNRKPGQPFFHVQNFGITHEGKLHFSKEEMNTSPTIADPKAMQPFPYHPNTPTYQYTYAKYHDLHQKADQAIQAFLSNLEADGLMEETIIFYYGDHGGVLPRSKGYIYESGIHVPLVVYFPEKWKHLAPANLGSRLNGFVQFVDLAPTVLHLANALVPSQMDGKPFLGKGITVNQLNKRNIAFSYADRFDEKYDLVRAIRKNNFKYIRHYQPFNFDGLFNFYRYKMLAYQEWASLFRDEQLNDFQAQFFQPKPAEALYDLTKDPYETTNLIGNPAYAQVLTELRTMLRDQVKSLPDLSLYPEPSFLTAGINNPVQFGQDHRKAIGQLVDIADLSLLPFSIAKKRIKKALKSRHPWKRYWGLIVCSAFGAQASTFYPLARTIAQSDSEKLVRVRAAEFLALTEQEPPQTVLLSALYQSENATEANLILNTMALLQDCPIQYSFEIDSTKIDSSWMKKPGDLVARRVTYINSTPR